MERRQFIRTSCKLCIGIAGATVFAGALTSCSPLPIYNTVYKDRQISVPLSEFQKTDFVIVRCSNINFDIAVIKEPDGGYKSMIMQCTHADNVVEFNGNEFTCSLHGSIFSREGFVKRGPAEKPLVTLFTRTEQDHLIISTKA
jgi:Rieske Fe-S protein